MRLKAAPPEVGRTKRAVEVEVAFLFQHGGEKGVLDRITGSLSD